MSKLQELIKTLRAFTILIIENDFSYIEDPKLILGNLCVLPEKNFNNIITELEKKQFSELSLQLKDFITNWKDISEDNKRIFKEMGVDYLYKFLEKINLTNIIDASLTSLSKLISEDEDDQLKLIFLKNGIFIDETVPKYQEILEHIKSIDECRIIIRREQPTSTEWEDFILEIEESVLETQSNFCLSIIDKSLGGGGQEGKELIKDLIEKHKDNEKIKHICCLYTSTPSFGGLENYNDYFVQEISKNSEQTIDDIVSVLTQSAYAEVFNSMRVKTIKSAEKTLQVVLKNQKNIKYIIDKSHEEGILPYHSIKYWNELSIQNEFDIREIDDFRFIASLTSFFNKDYLNDHPNLSDVSKELKDLNTFELFDYNVNKKHLSISPGDIWKTEEGKYYILLGQSCDLLLRKEPSKNDKYRNALIGELFEIEFGSSQKTKFDIVVNNGKKTIYIDHFYDLVTNDHKTIKIDISTPNIVFADLKVLDLAMFNDDGMCGINLQLELNETIKQILPINRDLYYSDIKTEYKRLENFNTEQLSIVSSMDSIEFSRINFKKNGNIINHGLQRVCRLKGRYFDSLYNNYLNHKGRIDLNLIENTNETSTVKSIYCQFGNNEVSRKKIELNVYSNKIGNYLLKKELIINLPSEFHQLADYFDDEIKLSDKKIAEIIQIDENSLEMKFRYRIDDKMPVEIGVNEFDFRFLFKNNQNRYKEKGFHEVDSPQDIKPFSSTKISIEQLISGIIIPDNKEKVVIINGFLKIEQIEG
ncbi:hypothetical protein [Elizabethkingia anophelis]|uniref:hypothetical protein n=1 Tax=Elizabethkingia anophelis TaxID=1117645 RepID=UPI001EE7114A|nr:hypothetical protein [Elizabethkingia anophelis]MDV3931284.1 hypothetical protein [Elizabethkingia anophelis]UKY87845.1 hypothetical protein KUF63_06345 [Elizabethkingia anophelis]UKZ01955.1 hypothetical protein KUF65_06350 [Elizabethkingia anophelis]